MPFRSCRAAGALTCAAFALLASPLVRANNVVGAWDPKLYTWPLIPVHAVIMPDMRIMTYGTDGIARQTGYFIYDIWDMNAGLDGGHLTLANMTATDIFCSSQVVLPQGGQVFIAGGDNWTGTGTTNTGNNNSTVFDLSSSVLSRGNDMNRARWYSVLDGAAERRGVYPGRLGRHRPARESAALNGTFRLLSGAEHQHARLHVSAQLHRAGRPRVRLRQQRAHVLRQPGGRPARSPTAASSLRATAPAMRARRCSARAGSCSSAATPTAHSSSTSPAARRS